MGPGGYSRYGVMSKVAEKQLIAELVENRLIDGAATAGAKVGDRERLQISHLEQFVRDGLIAREVAVSFCRSRIQLLFPDELKATAEAIGKVPFRYADYYDLLPLRMIDDRLECALANPFNSALQLEIETVLDLSIEPVWAFQDDIQEALRRFYGLGAKVERRQTEPAVTGRAVVRHTDTQDYAVTLVEELLLDASRKRATDVHLEPQETWLRIRYRIDGLLYEQTATDSLMRRRESIVARLKVLANLNLADRRKPQDGRIKTSIRGKEFDLRISVLPTGYGETVGIRLLNESQVNLPLDELGFSQIDLPVVERALTHRHGIILVTGPTGSGKSTTLYNFLRRLNTPERKIITIEDPIEYRLEGITQLQVKPQIQFTFANGLRSMLRHDPDIMMVGEIRDSETAKIAIQVALTGHLVLSTVHTNDSVSTLTRLEDMGIDRYMLTATLECVIAQRLVRLVCPSCAREQPVRPVEINFPVYEGEGCARCNHTGYFGRTGVFEILPLDQKIKDMIGSDISIAGIREAACKAGMRTLYERGMEKVRAGVTSFPEMLRILETSG